MACAVSPAGGGSRGWRILLFYYFFDYFAGGGGYFYEIDAGGEVGDVQGGFVW